MSAKIEPYRGYTFMSRLEIGPTIRGAERVCTLHMKVWNPAGELADLIWHDELWDSQKMTEADFEKYMIEATRDRAIEMIKSGALGRP